MVDTPQHGYQSGQNLYQQLGQGGQGKDIVQNAQNNDDDAAQQHPSQLRGKGQKNQHTEHEAEKDGQPPHQRDRVVVHPAGVFGDVHPSHPKCQGPDNRRGDQGDQSGGEQSGQGQSYGRKLDRHSDCSSFCLG